MTNVKPPAADAILADPFLPGALRLPAPGAGPPDPLGYQNLIRLRVDHFTEKTRLTKYLSLSIIIEQATAIIRLEKPNHRHVIPFHASVRDRQDHPSDGFWQPGERDAARVGHEFQQNHQR
ncbi:hypothetical protein [Streptomyces carminius]|uniref:hypothetical protein n=1 Tax=Streptomyces carminius TaxID=2665496 RepID=UPI0011B4754E|nr:hypothetical protein [Streptomyces carminius]